MAGLQSICREHQDLLARVRAAVDLQCQRHSYKEGGRELQDLLSKVRAANDPGEISWVDL